jgi:hypothetical protein
MQKMNIDHVDLIIEGGQQVLSSGSGKGVIRQIACLSSMLCVIASTVVDTNCLCDDYIPAGRRCKHPDHAG